MLRRHASSDVNYADHMLECEFVMFSVLSGSVCVSSPPSCSPAAHSAAADTDHDNDDDDDDTDDHAVIIIHYTTTILCSNSNYRVIVCLAWKT